MIYSQMCRKKYFYYYIWVGIYSVWLMAVNTYPEVVQKMYFLLLLLGMNQNHIKTMYSKQIYFCPLSAIYDVEAGELLKLVLQR